MAGTLFVGTSGYAFDEWKGNFYPEKVKSKEMLPFYASQFRTVEINYTFRHHPSEKTIDGWTAATPEGFVFTLKAHQRITHIAKLSAVEEQVQSFVERARRLGPRLGPILFQTPPYLRFDRDKVAAFLASLPAGGRYVLEPRHASFAEAGPLLREHGVALCAADTDEEPFAAEALDPGEFCYLRLRKTAYDDAELDVWAGRVAGALGRGQDVLCYFKHEDQGVGPRLARALAERVEARRS